MTSLPAGKHFKAGVIIGHEPRGEYHHSGSYRKYTKKDSVALLNAVAMALSKHHGMQLQVDHDTFQPISLFESKRSDFGDSKQATVLRIDNNTAHLTVNSSTIGLSTGSWAYIPAGVKCSLMGAMLGHTCMGVISKIIG